MIHMGRRGVNWAKSLPNYARILNEDARKELGWKSPFEIYNDSKSNVLWHANDDEIHFEPTTEEDIEYKIKNRYHEKHEEQIKKLRNHVKRYSEKKTQQLIKKYLQTKTYDVGGNVLIRGTKKNVISNTKLRHVIKGRICKKGKNSKCKVKFQNPMTNVVASKWISVEDIADLYQNHLDKGCLFRKMFLVPLSNEVYSGLFGYGLGGLLT